MKITIISDNSVYKKGLKSEWGFSALIERENVPKILFDTGGNGSILLYNMERLNIDPKDISIIFISHNHWDHTGGLKGFLKINSKVKLYVPGLFFPEIDAKEIVRVKGSLEIYKNIFSTGQLQGIEQSMIVRLDKGLVVIAGCSHPGVGEILSSASQFGKSIALIGGLHGFCEFDLIKDLDLICATHCTQYSAEIKRMYPEKFVEGGAGRIITI